MAMGSTLAQMPANGFSAADFFGSAPLTPQIASGRAAQANSTVQAVNKKHVLFALAGFIVLGYVLYHLNEKYG